MVVQKVPRDAHLHLVRTPPSCNLDALLYGRHWGLSRWCLGPLPSLRDCAASDQGPSHRAATYGVVAARRPPMEQTVQHRTYRNLCCTWYASYVPAGHITDCQDGAANGAGPSECTAGVTPAPSENLGQDD